VIANAALLLVAVALLYERGVYRRRRKVGMFARNGSPDLATENAAIPWWTWAGDWIVETRERIDRRWAP
jgi:hypothetical protein